MAHRWHSMRKGWCLMIAGVAWLYLSPVVECPRIVSTDLDDLICKI